MSTNLFSQEDDINLKPFNPSSDDEYLAHLEKNYPWAAEHYKKHNLKPPPPLPPLYVYEPEPEPVYVKPTRTLPDYVDQSPPSYNNERTWQDTSDMWKTTGNILGTAGGVYSYFDPVTGSLITGVGAGFSGVGNVIDYLTSE